MFPVRLADVFPGCRFSFTGDPAKGFPCMKLATGTDTMIKKQCNGSRGVSWHVYIPTGTLSWTADASTTYVYVERLQDSIYDPTKQTA